MPYHMESINKIIEATLKEAQKSKNAILENQLSDLVSRGLLVIEEKAPVMIQDPNSPGVRIEQAVRLVLKDMEYIKELEAKVAHYEKILAVVKEKVE